MVDRPTYRKSHHMGREPTVSGRARRSARARARARARDEHVGAGGRCMSARAYGGRGQCSRIVRTPPPVSSSTIRSPAGLRTGSWHSGQVKE